MGVEAVCEEIKKFTLHIHFSDIWFMVCIKIELEHKTLIWHAR